MIGVPTTVDRIDAELQRQWCEMGEPGARDPRAVFRARMLTLLVYVPDPSYAIEPLAAVVTDFTTLYPARAVFLLDRHETAAVGRPVAAWVALQCRPAKSHSRQLCSEQICLAVRGSAVRALASHVLPLLSPDLPVFLWWLGDLVSIDHLFRRLTQPSDRVIIDSDTFSDPEPGLVRTAELARGRRRLVMTDLVWTRLEPWRQLTSELFDRAGVGPGGRVVRRVRVRLAGGAQEHAAGPVPAYLYLAWLAARFGWTVIDGERGRAHVRVRYRAGDGATVETVIERGPIPGWPRAVSAGLDGVEIEVADGAVIAIDPDREPDCIHLRARAPGAAAFERSVMLRVPQGARLLARQVEWLERDLAYEEALQFAAALIRSLPPPPV